MPRANPIKGPGKFEGETYAARYAYENPDGEIGAADELGWYGWYSGPIRHSKQVFHIIVSEDNQGFVRGEFFDTKDQLNRAWRGIEKEYEKFDEGREE